MVATCGSSDVSTILGIPSWTGKTWKTPYELWAIKTGLYTPPDNPAAKRGRAMEGAVASMYADELRYHIRPGPEWGEPSIIGSEPWMACHPDRYAGDEPSGLDKWRMLPREHLVEVKTCRRLEDDPKDLNTFWGDTSTQDIPMSTLCQVHWQMAVIASKMQPAVSRCDVAVWGTVADELRIYTIHRNDALEANLVARCRDWWERHIVGMVPPDLDGSNGCAAVLAKRYAAKEGKVLRDPTTEDLALARDLFRIRRQLADLSAKKGAIEATLKERIGTDYGISGVGIWYPVKGRDSLDKKGLLQAHPELAPILKEHTSTGEPTRVFRSFSNHEDS